MKVTSVEHFKDEKLVGIVLDYESAGIVMHLLGWLCREDGVSEVFDALDRIDEVTKFYNIFMMEHPQTTSDLCGYYGQMLKEHT